MELTGTIEQRKMRAQFLDMMELEREKGITIKLQPVRMEYVVIASSDLKVGAKQSRGESDGITSSPPQAGPRNDKYILNLIDTPGHVDFTYEVSRSLAAVEGAVLLVDASQGIQAQTLANLHLAQQQGLVIIPVVNKIDLVHAQVEETAKEMSQLLGVKESEIIRISAKQGTNVEKVLQAIIKRVPCPTGHSDKPLRALVFDSTYDPYKGVIAYLRVVDGQIKTDDKILMLASGARSEATEVGIFKPELARADSLEAGQIGYLATGLKEVSQCRVGDTISNVIASSGLKVGAKQSRGESDGITSSSRQNVGTPRNDNEVRALPGYQEARPVVFASFYPVSNNDYNLLKDSLGKLKLNDASLQYEPESAEGLGRGFRCGFLGMLHLEIVLERLRREYKLDLIITSPSVSYRIADRAGKHRTISSPADFPETGRPDKLEEPWVALEIITPNNYLGQVMKLLEKIRGEYQDTQYLTAQRVLVTYQAPLNEIIVDFYDKLKNTTAGYASMNYQMTGYQPADLVKMDVLVAGEKKEAFSRIVHQENVDAEARALVRKLKETIPRQLFAVSLQAVVNGRIIARETIGALRKDVTGYLYGGDYTRKRKLLEKQKKGKKKMKALGKVTIPQDVFLKVLKK